MNWFDDGGASYAAHRPTYPSQLAEALAAIVPRRRLAVDVGCGNGQLTVLLAQHFDEVIGLDPSADQIANAAPADGVGYRIAPAEATGLDDAGADLITVAQAAHWFDLPAFYAEVRRIAAPGGVLALITYGVVVLEPELRQRFSQLYTDEIGQYWPPERRHVDSGYADLDFPFELIDVPPTAIERDWTLDQFGGYLRTWSAARKAEAAGAGQLIDDYLDDVRAAWGPGPRRVRWPITVIAGRIGGEWG